MKNDELDKLIFKSQPAIIEPSRDFETTFWKKVYEREREPKLVRGFQELISWIPTPSFAQAAAVVLVALIIGGGAGFVSAMPSPSVSLSGFEEIKGIPKPSILGAYFKMMEVEKTK